MDAFLDYLIKKSDVSKEFSIKGHSSKKKRISEDSLNYKKISIPSVESYVVFDFETTGITQSGITIREEVWMCRPMPERGIPIWW